MAETQDPEVAVVNEGEQDEDEDNLNYKPPAPKALDEIRSQDADDESLKKYKEALLGGALGENIIVDSNDPRKVIVKKLGLIVPDREEVCIDLTKSPEEIKKETFTMKEGCEYNIRIYFHVQREIVSGLRYEHKVYRKGLQIEKKKHMLGSYGPKGDLHHFDTPIETAPSGMLLRGDYKIKSKFSDDDKNDYIEWEWHLAVKKDWV